MFNTLALRLNSTDVDLLLTHVPAQTHSDQTRLASCGFSQSLGWDQAHDTAVVTSWVGCEEGEGALQPRSKSVHERLRAQVCECVCMSVYRLWIVRKVESEYDCGRGRWRRREK